VRGLDYYMRTTFEVTHGDLGAQNSVLGGGRYDGLAESLGSSVHSPGIGFSIGEDRLVMTVAQAGDPGWTFLSRRWAMPRWRMPACWRAICGAKANPWK
jgi:histidyl-tRNA synthetase